MSSNISPGVLQASLEQLPADVLELITEAAGFSMAYLLAHDPYVPYTVNERVTVVERARALLGAALDAKEAKTGRVLPEDKRDPGSNSVKVERER